MERWQPMGFFDFVFGIVVFFTMVSLGLTGLAGYGVVRLVRRLTGKARKELPPAQPEPVEVFVERDDYTHLDVDAGTTQSQVRSMLHRYRSDRVVGHYAIDAIHVLDSAELRTRSLVAELDAQFGRNTISWDRFAQPAASANDVILRNSAQLANRIQAFDSQNYRRLERQMTSHSQSITPPTEAQYARWAYLKETLARMDEIVEANENLLLEIDKLTMAVASLESNETSEEGERIIAEIQRLSDEMRYYRQ